MKKFRFKKMMVNLCLVAILAMGSGSIVYAAGNVPTFYSLPLKKSSSTWVRGGIWYNRTSGRSLVGIYTNSTVKVGDTARVMMVDGDGNAQTAYADFVNGKTFMGAKYKSGVEDGIALYFAGRLMKTSLSSSMNFSYAIVP